MKVYKVILSLALLLSYVTPVAFANDDNSRFKPSINVINKDLMREKMELNQKLRENVRERVGDKRTTITQNLSDNKKEIIKNYWERLTKRMNSSIERLDILIQRIEVRVASIEKEDSKKDTASIRSQIKDAKTKLSEAKTKLTALETTIKEALDSDSPKAAFEVIKEKVKEIKVLLVDTHKILVHLIGDIRGLKVGKISLTATQTITPTP